MLAVSVAGPVTEEYVYLASVARDLDNSIDAVQQLLAIPPHTHPDPAHGIYRAALWTAATVRYRRAFDDDRGFVDGQRRASHPSHVLESLTPEDRANHEAIIAEADRETFDGRSGDAMVALNASEQPDARFAFWRAHPAADASDRLVHVLVPLCVLLLEPLIERLSALGDEIVDGARRELPRLYERASNSSRTPFANPSGR